jgi:hypothetical protein
MEGKRRLFFVHPDAALDARSHLVDILDIIIQTDLKRANNAG